jgi:hypothetical protein
MPGKADDADGLDPTVVVRLLAEPARLRAFAALVLGAETLGEVAANAGISVAAASRALGRLVAGGLVDETPGGPRQPALYRVVEERLTATAQSLAGPLAQPPEDQTPAEKVLAAFFVDGHLVALPAARSKRRVVLDHLASQFEPGRVYPEREVNFVLGLVHADYAALRRYLVDEGFMERRDGFYWRSGGTFEVD